MHRPRLSISRLMVVIVPIAVSLAALSRPTRLWAAIVFGAMVTMLIGATIRWFSERDGDRDYWWGFCIAGWVGFLIHFGPFQHPTGHSGSDPFSQISVVQPSLFVVDLVFDCGQRVGIIHDSYAGIDFARRGIIPDALNQHPRGLLYMYWYDPGVSESDSQFSGVLGANQHPWFIQIGFSIVCLLIALVGGWYGRRIGRLSPSTVNPDRSGGR